MCLGCAGGSWVSPQWEKLRICHARQRGGGLPRRSAARWEQRLPVPHRNMVLLRGLLVLSLSCLQGPGLLVSLGLGLGGAGRQVGPRQGSGWEEEGG